MTSDDVVHQVRVAAASTIEVAIAQLMAHLPSVPMAILPSSGSRDDIVAATVRSHLRSTGLPSTLITGPRGPLAHVRERWRTVAIDPPDASRYEVALPAGIIDATSILIVFDVNRMVGTSPTVLDLLSHFVRWGDRVRLRATRNTAWVPEINLARAIDCIIASLEVDDGVIAIATGDVIAGELMALAMAEELLPRDAHLTGVWEDPLVQRATELGRWARYPGDLKPTVTIEAGSETLGATIDRIIARVGVRTT